MTTVVSIPSGYRTRQLLKLIEKWHKAAPDFEIAVYSWDTETAEAVVSLVDHFFFGDLTSFAVNHNMMAREIPDWDILICAADDLFPHHGMEQIERACSQCPGKVLWARDGLFDAQPSHPIITRQWYDKHGCIFDESYRHNFCDTDFFVRLIEADEVVKCFDIGFDHRHYLKTGEPQDRIYQIGSNTFTQDQITFRKKHPHLPDGSNVPEIRL